MQRWRKLIVAVDHYHDHLFHDLDGDYAVFGYVTEGMEVIDTIKQGDKIDSAKVVSGAENLKK